MNQSKREEMGFEFAKDAVKQLLTLATGVIALTATFSKDLLGSPPSNLKIWATAAWVALLLSIVFGCWCLLALAGHLGSSNAKSQPREVPSIYSNAIRLPAVLQVLAFLAGLGATVRYAVGML